MATQQTNESNHESQWDVFSLASAERVIKHVGPIPTPGESECAVHTLYEGPKKCSCCINWVEDYPDDLRILVEEQPDVKLKALIIRMRKSHQNNQVLSLHSVVVHSSSLKQTLGEVFRGLDNIVPSLKKLVFKAPFTPFYHRWQTLEKVLERQKTSDPGAAKYTQLLYDVLEKELHGVVSEAKDLLENRVMTYPLLWTLFEPGVLLVTTDEEDDERFFIATGCDYDQQKKHANIHARFVDWDGERFGYSDVSFRIGEYAGMRPINGLGLYPVNFHEDFEASATKALERGRKFRELRGFHYMAYSGPVRIDSSLQRRQEQIQLNGDGRIIIDASSYYCENPGSRQRLAALTSTAIMPGLSDKDDEHDEHENRFPWASRSLLNRHYGRVFGSAGKEVHTEQRSEQVPEQGLTNEQLLICNTHVLGYSFKWKVWAEFRVNGIVSIEFNSDAFDNMILPHGYKSLMLSLIEGIRKSGFDDIIQGKGLGNIMLLVGNPGIGKTLTAEALADKLRRPLYILSAGELGQSAQHLELKLTTVLELAAKWDAVLLFDECDVFLQKRSTAQLAHNEIVAVFLRLAISLYLCCFKRMKITSLARQLEYYRGILFMTTNRNDTIDPAFKSRIHMTLNYPDLAPEAKSELFGRFARLVTENHNLSDSDVKELALLPMNGREIKNVIKVAGLLACQEGKQLGRAHVDTVLRATGIIDHKTVKNTRGGLWSAAGSLISGMILLFAKFLAQVAGR